MLITDWLFAYDGLAPLACQAPCTMYSVLHEQGKIPDPFYGLNEQELKHLGEKDCTFMAEFTVEQAVLDRDYAELTFHGLDTICRITLNGHLLDCVKNMHRTYHKQGNFEDCPDKLWF